MSTIIHASLQINAIPLPFRGLAFFSKHPAALGLARTSRPTSPSESPSWLRAWHPRAVASSRPYDKENALADLRTTMENIQKQPTQAF